MSRVEQAWVLPRTLGIVLFIAFTSAGCGGAWSDALPKPPAVHGVAVGAPGPAFAPSRGRLFAMAAARPAPARADAVRLASIDGSVAPVSIRDGAPATSIDAAGDGGEPFGLSTFRAPEGLLWTKWRSVSARMTLESKIIEDCKADEGGCTSTAAKTFLAIVEAATGADVQARVEAVNSRVNQSIRYASDIQQHGVADFWSSPLESLAAGVGDCEDYAIAKLAVLGAAGIPEADMQLLLVQDTAVRQAHAVLGVRLGGRWLILDNRNSEIVESREQPQLLPLFAIDRRGVSLFAAQGPKRPPQQSQPDVASAAGAEPRGGGRDLPLLL